MWRHRSGRALCQQRLRTSVLRGGCASAQSRVLPRRRARGRRVVVLQDADGEGAQRAQARLAAHVHQGRVRGQSGVSGTADEHDDKDRALGPVVGEAHD